MTSLIEQNGKIELVTNQGYSGDWGYLEEKSRQGLDLVGVVNIGDQMQFEFSVRRDPDPSVWPKPTWTYKVNQEGVLKAYSQEAALNNGVLRGWELIAVSLDRDTYVRYYCRLPIRSQADQANPWWINKVVEHPIISTKELHESLLGLRRKGWQYRDHVAVPREDGFLNLVYLQKLGSIQS